jgi:hypothetical protein
VEFHDLLWELFCLLSLTALADLRIWVAFKLSIWVILARIFAHAVNEENEANNLV